MSTGAANTVKTIRLLGHHEICVPRTERFVGFTVYEPEGGGPRVVIKPQEVPENHAPLELGQPMPSAQYWADRWHLVSAEETYRPRDEQAAAVLAHEYVNGVSLTEFVKQTGPLPLPRLLTLVAALEAAEASFPEGATRLTPDRVMFTASGEPKFLVRETAGVGVSGCLWFALTGQPPTRERLSISLVRDDLPRALRIVVDAYLKGDRRIAHVRGVLQRLANPESMQLTAARSAPGPGAAEEGFRSMPRIALRLGIALFTISSVLLAGWQLQERFGAPDGAETNENRIKPMPAGYGWDEQTCLWDRLAMLRQAALEGRASVEEYTLPGSAAAESERGLQERLLEAGIEFTGLNIRLVPGQHDGRECVDPAGLLAWLPERTGVPERELEVYSLISGHRQRDSAGVVRNVKPVKQQLSVQLRLHRGRWVISSIAVADEHAQSLS